MLKTVCDLRSPAASAALALIVVTAAISSVRADESVVPAGRHAWGRFEAGAWKRVRIRTEVLDGEGRVVSESVSEVKTTLVSAGPEEYSLEVEPFILVGDKAIASEPQRIRRGYCGESLEQHVEIKHLRDEYVTIGRRRFASRVQQVTVNGDSLNRVTTIHLSDDVSPFVLAKRTIARDAKTNATSYQTDVSVLDVSTPRTILSETRDTAEVKTVYRSTNGSSVTIEWHCAEIPGGVVAHEREEFDGDGKLIRRSKLELVDYGFAPDPKTRRRIFVLPRIRGLFR